MNKLDIIVPVYNVEKYLDNCVKSILNQNYKEFNLILIDDGSTDSSGDMCDRWSNKDKRIYTYHKQNGGLMSAWKYGVAHSNSEYIGFVDSDDWIDKDMYECLIKEAQAFDADIVACGFIKEFENGLPSEKEKIRLKEKFYRKEDIDNKIFPILFSGGDYITRGLAPNKVTKIFKRKILEEIQDYCADEVSIGEDLLTTFACIQKVAKLVVLNNFYPYHYRINNGSMINRFSYEKYKKIVYLRNALMKVNEISRYDFRIQINTDFIKLMLMQLDQEILYSGKSDKDIRKSIRRIYHSSEFRQALNLSETRKLPIKYKTYLFFMSMNLYQVIIIMRRMKKV